MTSITLRNQDFVLSTKLPRENRGVFAMLLCSTRPKSLGGDKMSNKNIIKRVLKDTSKKYDLRKSELKNIESRLRSLSKHWENESGQSIETETAECVNALQTKCFRFSNAEIKDNVEALAGYYASWMLGTQILNERGFSY